MFNLAQKAAFSKGTERFTAIKTEFIRNVYIKDGDIYALFTTLVLSLYQNVRN
jgi:hypothetical protein